MKILSRPIQVKRIGIFMSNEAQTYGTAAKRQVSVSLKAEFAPLLSCESKKRGQFADAKTSKPEL